MKEMEISENPSLVLELQSQGTGRDRTSQRKGTVTVSVSVALGTAHTWGGAGGSQVLLEAKLRARNLHFIGVHGVGDERA